MLARVKEFDGDDDKLLAECLADTESDPPGEFDQEMCCGIATSAVTRIATRTTSSMASSVSTRRARMLCHSSGGPVECRQTRLHEDARAD